MCKNELGINLTAFAWGYCPRYSPKPEYVYHLQAEIIWKSCQGKIPSWTYFSDGVECNIGNPIIRNLIVRDSSLFWFDGHVCKECSQFFAGAAVKIIENRIESVWPYREGELDDEVDIYLISPDGQINPKPEWQDRKMEQLDSC